MQQSCGGNFYYCDINGGQKGQRREKCHKLQAFSMWAETADVRSHHLQCFSTYYRNCGSVITACHSVDDC